MLGLRGYSELAWAVIQERLPKLVTSDGFLREGSSHYHFLFTRWVLEICWLAEYSRNVALAAELKSFVVALLERCWFFLIADEKGGNWTIPLVGDISPDFLPTWLLTVPWSRLAEKWFKLDKQPKKPVVSGWAGLWETVPLQPTGLIPENIERKTSGSFPQSSWHRIDHEEFTLICRAEAESGRRYANHRHGDLTGFCVYWRGRSLLLDTGRYSYRDDDPWGTYGMSARSHNCLLVDGCEPQVPLGRTRLPGFYRACQVETSLEQQGSRLVFTLRHTGFNRLAGDSIQHRRRWTLGSGEMWIEDTVGGQREHRLQTLFHIAPEWCVISDPKDQDAVILGSTSGESDWVLRREMIAVKRDTIGASLCRGEVNPELLGWIFPAYGRRNECSTVSYQETVKLPWTRRYSLKLG